MMVRDYKGHRYGGGFPFCIDCDASMHEARDNPESGQQCAQERVLKGRSSSVARQISESELRTLVIDGVIYQERKIYRGMLCTGTRYHVADVKDDVDTNRQGERA